MMYPLVRELAAAPHRVPAAVTCWVLKMARQPYYRWLAAPVTDTELAEAYRANALFDAHRDDPEFGHRFLADEARAAGEPMTERTAWKISRDNRWWSAFRKRRGRGKSVKAGPPVSAHVSSERRASRCRLHQEAIVDHLFTVMGEAATPIARTGLAAEGLLERQHLQEWVIAHPQLLGESVLVVTAEYDRWAETSRPHPDGGYRGCDGSPESWGRHGTGERKDHLPGGEPAAGHGRHSLHPARLRLDAA
uniref:Integrase n=1 Tax=Streptomyces sp. NBC_00008 TaxID=2903610 RepID=A0AAU2W1T8_9ACTN